MVYELLMANAGVTFPKKSRPTSVVHVHPSQKKTASVPHSALDLLCVNHQVRYEAEGVLYSRNDLVFRTPASLQKFISTLGWRRIDALRSLTFFYKDGQVGDSLTHMEATLSLHYAFCEAYGDSTFWSRTPKRFFVFGRQPLETCFMQSAIQLA